MTRPLQPEAASPPGLAELLTALAAIADARQAVHIHIKHGDMTVTLDVSIGGLSLPFVPTPLQSAILDALAGKSLRTDAIAAKCDCDRSKLFKPGGIKELQEQGLVSWHKRLGYYRPDKPPPEMPTRNENDAQPSQSCGGES